MHVPGHVCLLLFSRFGGWIVDGFPETREQWSVMLEQDMVPDHVLVLGEPEGKEGLLNERVKSLAKDDPDKVRISMLSLRSTYWCTYLYTMKVTF